MYAFVMTNHHAADRAQDMSKPEGKQFVYHGVPERQIGSVLYPLHVLEARFPETFGQAISKYDDRPDRCLLPFTAIPALSCEWQDVVQCSPISPTLLLQAQREAGIRTQPHRFYEIDVETLFDVPAVLFTRNVQGIPHYQPVDWSTYREMTVVPEKALAWYRQLAGMGKRGALFHGVPHVMIRGSVDISGASIVEWSSPEEIT